MYHYHMRPFRRKIYKKKCEMAHFCFSPILYLESLKKNNNCSNTWKNPCLVGQLPLCLLKEKESL